MLVIYLHGYGSTPDSSKCIKMKDFFLKEFPSFSFIAPKIEYNSTVLEHLTNVLMKYRDKKIILIGSSIGGLFARYLTERSNFNIKATILINPALKIFEAIENSGIILENTDQISSLNQLIIEETIDEDKYLLLCQNNDDICCWKFSRYLLPNSGFYLGHNSGHGFENIDITFDAINSFICKKLDNHCTSV